MYALAIGGAVATSLIIIAFIALKGRKHKSTITSDTAWLRQYGTTVMATVTDVQSKQDWKYGERWSRNTWNGNLEQEKTWQTYYDVTAKWVQPATKQVYTFHWKVWATERASIPKRGSELCILLNPQQPDDYYVDVPAGEQS
jgi:hypothetical protein